jgi:hypothetical protein
MSVIYSLLPSTVHYIISTCKAIWNKLFPTELPQPTEEWKKKAGELDSLWQFPNCIGAIDSKHVKYKHSGSLFFNYKTFYVLLLALVDANYKFP